MTVRERADLSRLNTFGVPSVAERLVVLRDTEQLGDPIFDAPPTLVLGGGSNVLLLDHLAGLTVVNRLLGIEWADGRGRFRVYGGTDWNQFVLHTLNSGFGGLENLILIPGTVGAAPVQNIGAYGAEVAEFITAVHAHEYGCGPVTLPPEACGFGYRDSRFKREPRRYLITAVEFDLSDYAGPRVGYGAMQTELERLGHARAPTPKQVALAVTNIRRSKLPDWFFYGNSGSFFKNPVVPKTTYEHLLAEHPDCPAYPIDDAHVKLAAGWLIDRAGWRGKRRGAVGSYRKQALVMVNHAGATGGELLAFSREVQAAVLEHFGVTLEREVRLFGTSEG